MWNVDVLNDKFYHSKRIVWYNKTVIAFISSSCQVSRGCFPEGLAISTAVILYLNKVVTYTCYHGR